MYLKSLEMQGFKSFPDKIKLSFDKGLTAVVGPNGSGKSNIGDAVRWVLGEQSTKTLRGNKMEDVIFSGTMTRKPVGFAAVTLNIDNSQRRLDISDDEVRVTRKLFRSGESEYLINGKSVRLKDVNELFMDTGLGRDGYSIIGQGRISEIVGAKSGDRRDIFEEAAGISKFRYKKEEAQRRLASAQDNILRLNDIVAELEDRVEPLRIQSEKAEKFLVMADRKKRLEISFFMQRLNDLKGDIGVLQEKILICEAQHENIENDIENEEKKIQSGYRKMQEISVQIEKIRLEISDCERKSAECKSDIAVFENDIMHGYKSIEAVRLKQAEEQNSSSVISEKLAAQKVMINEITVKENDIIHLLKETEERFKQIENEAENTGKSFGDAETRINNYYIKQSEYRLTLSSSENSVNEMQGQLERETEQSNFIKNELIQYGADIIQLKNDIEALSADEQELNNRLDGYEKIYQTKRQKYDDEKQNYADTELKLKGKQQKVRLFTDLENSMEGFAVSVKEIIKISRNSSVHGIRGTVAQLIKVDSKYAAAIETALGGALQNIIVDDENTAKRCIRILKDKNAGRATFLPITSVKGSTLNEKSLHDEDGFVAFASELVSFDQAYNGIISFLLGRIAVAEDIDSAAVIAKKYGFRFRIVTLDGQVINAGGSFTGGSAVRSSGVLTRKNEIGRLNDDIIELTAELKHMERNVEKLKNECIKLSNCIGQEKEKKALLTEDKIKFQSEFSRITAMENQAGVQLENSVKRIKDLESRLNEYYIMCENAERNLAETQKEISALENSLAGYQGKHNELQKQRKELTDKLSDIKIKQMELLKDREAAVREYEILKQAMSDSEYRCGQALLEIKEHMKMIDESQRFIEQRKNQLEQTDSAIKNYGDEIKKLQLIHDEYEKNINGIRNSLKAVNSDRERILQEKSRLDERKFAVQKDFDGIILQLWEEYELTRSEAEEFAQKLPDMIMAKKELNELRNDIKSLGNVNVAAIEEYKEVSERYKFLSEQLADVKSSKSEMEKLISDLTQDMKRIFEESFVQINSRFKQIFMELFGGGKAELVLTDPENILESGIEINVAPPGKVIKNLISLSGGEQAFVAIAIYFSILTVRPAPFCILDEIDAALDDVNVMKYAQYLKKFTDTTQFILVTHRRGSMEAANVLYGVTMQENGISKLLKLEQVDFSENQ